MIYSKEGKTVKQPQSPFVKLGIYAQQIPFLGSFASGHLTKYCGRFKEKKNSPERIQKFAETYNIQPKDIQKCQRKSPGDCWNQFETLNDFFIRHRIGLPKPNKKQNIIVSPADCYSVYLTEPKAWIKGTKFTSSRLMTGNDNKNFPHLNLIIFRLAPHHYHRFHCPVYGTVKSMQVFGSQYNSVDPIVVNSFKNVYTSNVRIVLEIETKCFGTVYLAIIGATCVGSIVINHKAILKALGRTEVFTDADLRNMNLKTLPNAPIIKVNEELGYFQYGGSTIVLGVSPETENMSLVKIGNILFKHSEQLAETEIHVGDELLHRQKC